MYAIVSSNHNSGNLNALLVRLKGIAGAALSAVSLDEISAVVSDLKFADLIADRAGAIEYAGVIETLAQHFTLLPMRFGSAMESAGEIKKMLEKNYAEIRQNLQNVDDRFEFGLKILCDSKKIKAELNAASEAHAGPSAEMAPEIKNSVYRNYVNEKLKVHRLEVLLVAYVDSVIAESTGSLTQLRAVCKFKKMVTESMIVDAVFLLDKKRKDALIRAVGEMQNQHPGLNFVLTGPWPPYNFVDFIVK